MMSAFPYLGFGLGLRPKHYDYILEKNPPVDWFEIITEDYLIPGGKPLYYLEKIRQNYPLVFHGVSLSIGSCDPLNFDYLKQVKQLAERIQPKWISDHLCWTGIEGKNMHDLLPLPYTEEALNHVITRVKQVQDFLERKILLENPSTYIAFEESDFTEWDFLKILAQEADCLLLLDINNIYVNAYNHGYDTDAYLQTIPKDRVQQFHLAGHDNQGDYIIDTHDEPIIDAVWELYQRAVKRFGKISTMIERDDNIPEFPELFAELNYAKKLATAVIEKEPAHAY